ncbi:hypothetical protein EVAR_62387_1 [Eumeta japonica]|uniref:Uncharacterized protein n=1 Tax=Eumeta variegata TaxID=151549 RepID=A0A4C1Z2M5_EUMVA|nr:hypothetical protein EVAR_62387_1 [Eumeta japonica]
MASHERALWGHYHHESIRNVSPMRTRPAPISTRKSLAPTTCEGNVPPREEAQFRVEGAPQPKTDAGDPSTLTNISTLRFRSRTDFEIRITL